MGIPSFYRWLVDRYPRCIVDVVEETPASVNGAYIPIDTSKPNPNGIEFDNLYLDMNGIIHPCFHPEGLLAPKTYDEVFKGVFKYIDRIFSMIRPRKLLYMAIDGVAPRAKMNQQRTRRFRTAKEAAADEGSKEETLRGVDMTGEEKVTKLDSNVITPGTEFMELLSSALQYYIHLKMNSDPGWQGIKVILSDASVPGEGEHKIMSYIRLQRNLPGYEPNTRHCLYGLDADLIMLSLTTHEVHFSVLREDVHKEPPKQGNSSSNLDKSQERGKSKQEEEYVMYLEDSISRQRFQFLNIWVLRDYLALELRIQDPAVKVDLERLIDDFVFMCLFVGNDFLPHVPSLEISEGAIDLLIMVYKKEFNHMGGYLTNSSEVGLEHVEHFLQAVGAHENGIFRKRNEAQKYWERLRRRSVTSSSKGIDKSMDHVYSEALVSIDKVKLGEDGWKERYYCEKFEVQSIDEFRGIKRNTVLKYVEGICWVMHYYYQGVCSWNWFYPYHYAPFASDFQSLNQLEINFLLGKPFKPFDQLMGVLPAASAQALPLSYRKLMTDPCSPILDFYPSDFELDLNGKRHAWQAVCKLPFIEEMRLLSEIKKVEHTLSDDEKKRNSLGLHQLFVHKSHRLAANIFSFCERNKDNPKLHKAKLMRKIDPKISDGMNGYVLISYKPVCPAERSSLIDDMELITENKVVSAFYKPPSIHSHIAKPPTGVIFPRETVSEHDLRPPPVLWHQKTAFFRSRVSERRIPPRSISGPCLKKWAYWLVSKNCEVKQKGSDADGGSKNNSEVRRGQVNCQMEEKDSSNVDGSNGKDSQVRKREGDMLDEIGKRKKKKKNKRKNKTKRNNADKGTENNSEVKTGEQNFHVDQKDCNVDGEGENHSEASKSEQNFRVEQKDSSADGSSERNSQVRKRGRDMADDKVATENGKKKNRNDANEGNENDSEVTAGEQNCQVRQKVCNMDGESENNSDVNKGSNVDGNSEVGKRGEDMPDDNIAKEKRKKKNRNDANKGNENNSEVTGREKICQVYQKDSNTDGNVSIVGIREQSSYQVEQKDGNVDGSSEKDSQVRKREGDMIDDKIPKKKRKRNKTRNNSDKGSEDKMRKQNCPGDKKRVMWMEKVKKNYDVGERDHKCQLGQKESDVSGNSENISEVRKQNCGGDQKESEKFSEIVIRDENYQVEHLD